MLSQEFALQDTIYRLVQDRPDWRRYLNDMVEWENRHPPRGQYDGWEWQDVHCQIGVINQMIAAAIVDRVYKSRTSANYRLRSLADTVDALKAIDAGPEASRISVDELFNLVVGHEKIKQLIRFAVGAERPVHVLLEGPPGTAKTLMLQDVGRLPGAQFYVGSTTTKSGLVGLLLQEHPRFLVIDEIDKMADIDQSPLLNLMETGTVTVLHHGDRQRMEMDCRVFAGGNDSRRINSALMSRFAKFEIAAYTEAEFVTVASAVLEKREGYGPAMAELIATEVVRYSTDIRDAVRVARMARNDPNLVIEVVKCLWPRGRRPTPTPVGRR